MHKAIPTEKTKARLHRKDRARPTSSSSPQFSDAQSDHKRKDKTVAPSERMLTLHLHVENRARVPGMSKATTNEKTKR